MNLPKDRAKLHNMIAELTRDKDELEKRLRLKIENLQNDLQLARKEQLDKVAECAFEINFAAIKAFSIERHVRNDGVEATNIGYLNENKGDRIGEWTFTCSRATHDRLAREFLKYKEEVEKFTWKHV